MGDPTDTELAGLNTIDETAAFTQLDGAENDVRTSRGSFLQLLGFNAGARMAALGMISEADVDAALAAWKIATVLDADGRVTSRRDPTMADLGKAKLIARICRQKIGIGVSTTGVSTTVVASSVAARKIKLSQVLSQVDDTEIDVLTEPQLVGMYARYEHLFGKGQRPHPSREPSVEQLTAIHGLIRSDQNPYVDFAIFGPFATRLKKRLKFQGLTLSKDGELIQTELHGPQNFATWKASFEVYYNALIMVDAVDLGSVLDYLSRIERFHDRFGEKAWALLYQADVRARLEELPRVKMQLAREHADAGATGSTTPFDPSRPWNYAFKMLSERDKFWNSEFSEPALVVLANRQFLPQVLSDDAPTGKSVHDQLPRLQAPSSQAPGGLPEDKPPRPRNQARSGRYHETKDGLYTLNRTGYKLCEQFQKGECNESIYGSWCPKHRDLAHQCVRCLGTHPLNKCPYTEMPEVNHINKSSSSGKGKGKGKGKAKKPGSGSRAPY